MKDLPMFTTENGVVSLTLQEIPYCKVAYITVHSTTDLKALLAECADFCKAVGAERVYACGCDLIDYPLYTEVWEMSAVRSKLPQTDARLCPVNADSLQTFLEIYRKKMKDVPTAAYLTTEKGRQLVQKGNCYFVHKNDALIGIGVAGEGKIQSVASLVPGGGKDVVLALCDRLSSQRISLEVASENRKAVSLYESLGFSKEKVRNTWYKIL